MEAIAARTAGAIGCQPSDVFVASTGVIGVPLPLVSYGPRRDERGRLVWHEPAVDDRPYNTLVTVDAEGAVIGAYRKLHLYDAFDHRESDLITPGDRGILVVAVAGVRVGLQTCYDLRFPEVTRLLADAAVDLVLVPADWVPGPRKVDHWRTLLRARRQGTTICPSDAARVAGGEDWRDLMDAAREVAAELHADGVAEVPERTGTRVRA